MSQKVQIEYILSEIVYMAENSIAQMLAMANGNKAMCVGKGQ